MTEAEEREHRRLVGEFMDMRVPVDDRGNAVYGGHVAAVREELRRATVISCAALNALRELIALAEKNIYPREGDPSWETLVKARAVLAMTGDEPICKCGHSASSHYEYIANGAPQTRCKECDPLSNDCPTHIAMHAGSVESERYKAADHDFHESQFRPIIRNAEEAEGD